MKVEVKQTGGISFLSLLTILFIGLKLTNYIDWSWFWVLSPVLIPAIIATCILGFIGGVFLLAKICKKFG